MFTTLATALLSLAPCAVVPEEPTLEERLAVLCERIEAQRVNNHIPGLALAVVVEGEVVLARGFGLADIEAERAVEADTIFAIGSTTKAFTATAIGMLQDDGVMDFDDPVTKYLPGFELPVDAAGEDTVVTVRDLLSHRTGFTRMSMLWNSNSVPRARILETAVRAEPWAEFRDKFLYNNVMYLAAGMASGVAADLEWEQLVGTRILEPLGMTSSNFSVTEAQRDPRLALGYDWNPDTESFDRKPMLVLDAIGPAGSINSNVLDMAQWLRLMLGRGEYEGQRLISEEALAETWTANMPMGDGNQYGLGWMLHDNDGERIVEHGGNINGFSAQVGLMPEAEIGYVLLANVSMTTLQQGSLPIVFDTLLGELSESESAPEGLEEYLGNYRANFATFADVDFEVLVQNEHLAVDVPGQMVFELHAPDEDGKWFFRLTNTIAVSFDRNAEDEVVGMKMYQSGMTFELPREGAAVATEIPLAELERFLGTYQPDGEDLVCEVLIQNQHLAVDIPGEMVFELHAPDAEGKRQFRVTDRIAVRFNEDDTGAISSFTLFEGDKPEREVLRIAAVEATASRLPSVEELLELREAGGIAKLLAKHGTVRSHGSIELMQSGISGTVAYEARLEPLAYRARIDLGEFGRIEVGAGDGVAWTYSTGGGYQELSGDALEQGLLRHPAVHDGDWRDTYDVLEVRSREQLDDAEVLVVQARIGDLPPWTMFVDAESGDVIATEYLHAEGAMKLPMRTRYEDFRELGGERMACITIDSNDWSGRSVTTLGEVEGGVDLAPDFHVWRAED